ncbi:MAG: MFS transporter [Clostridia bacterium]|nr:MFS transporter [Clostridia bacterium]
MKRATNYKYIIAGICFIMVLAGLGFCSSAKSMYFAAITDALGLSRSAFSINDSCRYITTAIVNIFFGSMVERFGTKKLIIAGMVSLIISSLLYSYATTLFMFYLGGIFLGIGVAWTTTSMVGVVINRWFKENKGTVMGIVLASNGLGAAIAIHNITPIIYSSAFGYQSAYRLTALILLAVTIFIVLLYKENPPKEEIAEKENTEAKEEQSGIEYRELIKKPYFYAIMSGVFLHMLVSVGGITTPHFTDIGLSPAFVATTLSLMVIALAVFKLLSGVIYDHMGIKVSTNICLFSVVISKLLLLFITNSFPGKVLTVVYCLINALATPIETVMLPILALDIFGQKCFNKTLGILTSVATVGQALGTPLLNLFYDYCKSYNSAFVYSALASVLVVIIMNFAMNKGAKNND